jgi:sulfite exporter TauE/SafE
VEKGNDRTLAQERIGMTGTNVAVDDVQTPDGGSYPARRGPLIAFSLLAGLAVAIVWSATLVDDDIGVNTANGLLGHNSVTTSIAGSAAGILFAFTAGLAGTFTACNVAAFSAIAPMMDDAPSVTTRVKLALRPLAWLAVGLFAVAGAYGAIGAVLGQNIPQLSAAMLGNHVPERILQSMIVFSMIGLIFCYLGLAAAGAVPDPLRRMTERFAHTPQLVMGGLIGGFLIGRPYPLFYKMFLYSASTHNPFYGALSFVLVALGNILLMAVVFLALSMTKFQSWLRARPGRIAAFTAAALLIGGAFTFFYWGVRVPAGLGYGWFPTMPWH